MSTWSRQRWPNLRQLRAVTLSLVLATSLLVVSSVPVGTAHHDGTQLWGSSFANPCDRTIFSQCIANNTAHWVRLSSVLGAARDSGSRWGMGQWAANSEIDVKYVDTEPFDVYVTVSNRPDINAFAWGQCAPIGITITWGGTDASHERWCRPQYIYWNTWSAAADKVNSAAKYNYIGCHEGGHTMGMRHRAQGSTSCMVSASSGPADPNSTVPSLQFPQNADLDRLDNHYPL